MIRFERFANLFDRNRPRERTHFVTEKSVSDADFFSLLENVSYEEDVLMTDYGISPLEASAVQSERFTKSISSEVLTASASLMSSVGSMASLFAHGGALCAHCVTSIGSAASNLGKIGMPGIGNFHLHADGTKHFEDDEEEHKHSFTHTPSSQSPAVSYTKPKRAEQRSKAHSYGDRLASVQGFVSSIFFFGSKRQEMLVATY